jgi:hypothetical protein
LNQCNSLAFSVRRVFHDAVEPDRPSFFAAYRPLLIIVGLIILPVAALALRDASAGMFAWESALTRFMAGFFLVFSGLKLLDVRGFAKGYAKYDLLAAAVPAYGLVYPFLELLLGLAYLTGFRPDAANAATLILMTFSGIGVARKLLKRERFQCACLGTFINVPLTKITLVEDFGMAAMSAWMLLAGR